MLLLATRKRIALLTGAILISVVAFAQVCDTVAFQNIYWIKDILNTASLKGLADNNDNIILGGNTELGVSELANTINLKALVIKTNKRGTPLWAKAIGAGNRETIQDFTVAQDNGIVLAGSTRISNRDGEGWITKIDKDGNVVWSLGLGQGAGRLSKVIELADGGFAAIGSFPLSYTIDELGNIINPQGYHALIVCVNNNGTQRWAKEFYSTKNTDRAEYLIQLADNNLLMSGETGYLDSLNHAFLIKLDVATGNPILSAAFKGFPAWKLHEMPDKNIRIYGGYNICDIDSNLSPLRLKQIQYNLNFYNIPEVIKVNPGTNNGADTTYYAGNITIGAAFIPILFKIVGDSTMLWSHSYRLQTNIGITDYLDFTTLNNNTFGVCGFFRTEGFSTSFNPPKSEVQTYFVQTDADGRMPCMQDVPFTFTARQVPSIGFIPGDLTGRPFQMGPVPNAAISLLPRYFVDCFTTTCCHDTILYSNASVCEGTAYTLPDGVTVSAAGVYTSFYQKSKGCDSVIMTNLTVKKPLQISLGNDTCLINNQPVTYKLSNMDSTTQYLWQDGARDSFYKITQPGMYWVKATNQCNIASDTIIVYPDCALPLYLPTAFSPNGDGLNDAFRIKDMKGMHLLGFSIYNRFGGKMFFTRDTSKGWDGNVNGVAQQAGTYVYVITYKDIAGNIKVLKNYLVLLR